ncbi:hypothetical protein ES703_116796 [subsurface metagenome]
MPCYDGSMKTLSGRQEPENSPSSLDNENTSSRRLNLGRKRYRRMFHRVMSGLERKGNLRLLTLTSSPGSGDFQRDFRKLQARLQRRGLLESYIRVPELTKTGLRHDHILFRGSYIEQVFLSRLWAEIHNSPVVDIRRVGGRRRLACYLASYLAKSPAGRYSYSWSWVWRGFAKSWARLKRFISEGGYDFQEGLTYWKRCCRLNIRPEEELPI